MIKIIHIITDLDRGGAEMMLFKLVSTLDREHFHCRVLSLDRPGAVGQEMKDQGIRVDTLGMQPGSPNPLALVKAVGILRSWSPHIVQTWMYHADLLGTFAWKISGRGALIWNIRCTDMDLSKYRRTTGWVVKGCAALSSYPRAILANSYASMAYHRRMQYRPNRSVILPNGFDLDRFRPDKTRRIGFRREFGIPEKAPCIGLVARFDPMKDHKTFFAAAGMVARKKADAHFVLCGKGVVPENRRLGSYMDQAGPGLNVHLLGPRDDIHRIMAGLDLFVLSSSYGESFPNVLGEAMACCVPCVVTDVGGAREVVGEMGRVVPPKDPAALAKGMLGLLSLSSAELHHLGLRARERVRKHYLLDKVVSDYGALYEKIAAI